MEAKHSPSFSEPVVAQESAPVATSQAATRSAEALKDIAFGSVAGAAGKVIEFPFDTVKVRLQSQPETLPLRYKGPVDCFRQSVAADGIRGLYRGVSAPLVGAAAETACLFFSYRVAQDALRSCGAVRKEGQLPLGALVTAAAMSGSVTSLILTPIELVKCRMQVPSQSRAGLARAPPSPFAVVADVYRREGMRGFWRGQLGTFLRETGGTAAWFGSYEASSAFFKARLQAQQPAAASSTSSLDIPIHQQMASGALAGMSYNFIFYPADTIKSKIQTGELAHRVRPTFLGVGKALWRAQGLKGLYRGCGITVARSAPSSALIFTLMERLKAAFA